MDACITSLRGAALGSPHDRRTSPPSFIDPPVPPAVLSDSLADLNASIEGTNRAVPGFCRYYPGACQETNRRRTLLACAVAFAWLSW